MSNVLINLPNLPEIRLTRAFALCDFGNKKNRFVSARAATPFLMSAMAQVVVVVNDVCDRTSDDAASGWFLIDLTKSEAF